MATMVNKQNIRRQISHFLPLKFYTNYMEA